MDKEEILDLNRKYDKDHSWWTQTERDLGDKLRKTRELTKDDLITIVEWKFKDLPWKNDRVSDVAKNEDTLVRRISSDVFNSSLDDSYKMDSLQKLHGSEGL
jgi:hypothetical protein